jgi:hypothetical protein
MWQLEYSPKKGGKESAIARLTDEQYENCIQNGENKIFE